MKAVFIRAALKKHFPHPECAILYEVAATTGFNARRRIDAVAMDLWPSRGLALHAIEIKVSRSDWRREKNNPAKAEELAQYCDFFWVAAPKGLIPIEDLPTAWGLLSVDKDGRVTVAKKAVKTEAQEFGRAFVAALLRAASRPVDPTTLDAMLIKHKANLEASFDRRVQARVDRVTASGDADGASWRKLVNALDGDAGRFLSEKDVIGAVLYVWKSGVTGSYTGLKHIQKELTRAADRIKEAINAPKV